MNIKELTKDELREFPMVEIAYEVMKDAGKPFNYYDLFKAVAQLKELTKAQMETRMSHLYTDINIDGRFHSLGNNEWGLKDWYPFEQTEEEITTPIKKKKAVSEDDEGFDDLEEEFDELDEDEDDDEDEEEDEREELDEDEVEEDLDFDEKDDVDELDEAELDEEFDEDEEE